MTNQEHELMIMMFARANEAIGILTETLKSRGLWTEDDEKAFAHMVHADDQKLLLYTAQARNDYLRCATSLGVVGTSS
jgi:hypothetical protein